MVGQLAAQSNHLPGGTYRGSSPTVREGGPMSPPLQSGYCPKGQRLTHDDQQAI